jgi:hypothetical protein
VKTLLRAAQTYGMRWLAMRLTYELQIRSGYQTLRFPQRLWDTNELDRWLPAESPLKAHSYGDYWRQNRPPFFFGPLHRQQYRPLLCDLAGHTGVARLKNQVEQIRRGNLTYFFSTEGAVGQPPAWHRNPFTGQYSSATAHWSRIPMYSRQSGDLKFIWEPGRFAVAFTLARAYWTLGLEDCAELFWQLVESWRESNPPNHGAHWKCGQETSFRLMAWCFALYAFADSSATTNERIESLVGMIAAQADRIAKDHVYAHLQRNNHAISEGVGLWTVGLLFPELRKAQTWKGQGREILIREATDQIARDGSYVQNSTNYHRLMLQDYLWAIRLGQVCGDPLDPSIGERICKAAEFLEQLIDPSTGNVPNYGNNDGALILPLNGTDYSDFRPVTAAAHFLGTHERLFKTGLWHEDLLWLFGPKAFESSPARIASRSFSAEEGGYYVLRGQKSFALTRCTSYTYRPGQADMLAFDLWRNGENICCDPGTYLYYADPPWNNSLTSTSVHNTVSVDGRDQMTPGPRFIWLNWTKARLLARIQSADGVLDLFQGQHSGYAPTVHRRAIVRAGDDLWLVIDDILGTDPHEISLQWLLAPSEYALDPAANTMSLQMSENRVHLQWMAAGFLPHVTCGDEAAAPRGWRSRYYGVKEPALSFELKAAAEFPCRVITLFSFGNSPASFEQIGDQLVVNNALRLELEPLDAKHLMSLKKIAYETSKGITNITVQE